MNYDDKSNIEFISQEIMDTQADNFEEYLNIIENFVILRHVSKDVKKDAIKTIRKLIKKLRAGDKSVYKGY